MALHDHTLAGGAKLRRAREARGLSVGDASRALKIPERYLDALERDDASVFPRGPFLSAYRGQYQRWLDMEAPRPAVRPHTPEPTITSTAPSVRRGRDARRLVVAALAVTAVALLVVVARGLRRDVEETTLDVPPDLTLSVGVVEQVRARVVADGREVFRGALSPGTQHPFAAHDRLELDIGTLDQVTIFYRGQRLEPLGTLGRPRTLVFIDDAGR